MGSACQLRDNSVEYVTTWDDGGPYIVVVYGLARNATGLCTGPLLQQVPVEGGKEEASAAC